MPTPAQNHDLEGCFVCGSKNAAGMHLEFEMTAPGQVEATCRLDPSWTGWKGLAHGGLLAMMMDEAFGWAVATLGRTALTARFEVRYILPVQPGADLIVRANVLRHDRRMAQVAAAVHLPDGRPVANAHATMVYADDLPIPSQM